MMWHAIVVFGGTRANANAHPSAVETLAETLQSFPLDVQLISEVVYTHSKVMDFRHFAEEYIRRKKLADRGVFDKRTAATVAAEAEDDGAGDGWNEVVKRGGGGGVGGGAAAAAGSAQADAVGASFKVVPSRKKGRK